MTIGTLQSNVQNIVDNLDSIVLGLTMEANPSVVDLNREQMMEGQTNKGEDITPKYADNPYFKSKESAQRYSDWKDDITPNSKRKKGVPNLFINGKFHNSLEAVLNKDFINVKTDSFGEDIIQVHRNVLGLNEESLKIIREDIKPKLQKKLKDEIQRS
jgi:hypothetical protein